MKTFIFSITAVLVLFMTTSCQKEEIAVPAEHNPASAILQSTDADNVAAMDVLTKPGQGSTVQAVIWEDWQLCGKDLTASKEYFTKTDVTLTLFDQNQNIWMVATQIDPVQAPADVQQALDDNFPGLAITALWRSAFPSDNLFIGEYVTDSGDAFLILLDKGGSGICKGTH